MKNTINYLLHLADNSLIMAQRLSEWCGHGPILEQDIALSNIALDYVGQARNLYQYAAELKGEGTTEDSLAYLRNDREYLNCLLVELPNGDWAQTVLKIFFFSSYQYYLYQQLRQNGDERIAAIAEKSLKEVSYHLKWSSEWVIRLGDGTAESKRRMEMAIPELWSFTGELFEPVEYESGFTDPAQLKDSWNKKVETIFHEATLPVPAVTTWFQSGGKSGIHTEHLGYILAEMQVLQREHPGATW
ncbi:MAG TPA: 1,2-phenylacetyl-CoA epoxidase subunit PaaC [Chitinophagaceae bacterium]